MVQVRVSYTHQITVPTYLTPIYCILWVFISTDVDPG